MSGDSQRTTFGKGELWQTGAATGGSPLPKLGLRCLLPLQGSAAHLPRGPPSSLPPSFYPALCTI